MLRFVVILVLCDVMWCLSICQERFVEVEVYQSEDLKVPKLHLDAPGKLQTNAWPIEAECSRQLMIHLETDGLPGVAPKIALQSRSISPNASASHRTFAITDMRWIDMDPAFAFALATLAGRIVARLPPVASTRGLWCQANENYFWWFVVAWFIYNA